MAYRALVPRRVSPLDSRGSTTRDPKRVYFLQTLFFQYAEKLEFSLIVARVQILALGRARLGCPELHAPLIAIRELDASVLEAATDGVERARGRPLGPGGFNWNDRGAAG
jgi:hypothetical protein